MHNPPSPSGGSAPAIPIVKPEREIETEKKDKLAPRYKVFIHNDDVTPMDFVVMILCDVFRKEINEAARMMAEAHHRGVALVGVYSHEEAEFRVDQAHAKARTAKFPLTFTYEPE